MKKTELNSQITSILERNKIELSSELAKELLSLVEIKTKSSNSNKEENLPKYDENNNIVELYCNWFKEYRPVSDFNKSTKSKTGYHYESKEAEKHWKQYTKEINQIKEDILLEKNAVLDGVKTREEAKEEIAILESKLNQLESDRLNKINHHSIESTLLVEESKESKESKESTPLVEESKESTPLVEESKEIITKPFPKRKSKKS